LKDNGRMVAAIDVSTPAIAEVIGGRRREERLEKL
jgi:aspartyl/asparaginyl-tRNA synthetase